MLTYPKCRYILASGVWIMYKTPSLSFFHSYLPYHTQLELLLCNRLLIKFSSLSSSFSRFNINININYTFPNKSFLLFLNMPYRITKSMISEIPQHKAKETKLKIPKQCIIIIPHNWIIAATTVDIVV